MAAFEELFTALGYTVQGGEASLKPEDAKPVDLVLRCHFVEMGSTYGEPIRFKFRIISPGEPDFGGEVELPLEDIVLAKKTP